QRMQDADLDRVRRLGTGRGDCADQSERGHRRTETPLNEAHLSLTFCDCAARWGPLAAGSQQNRGQGRLSRLAKAFCIFLNHDYFLGRPLSIFWAGGNTRCRAPKSPPRAMLVGLPRRTAMNDSDAVLA